MNNSQRPTPETDAALLSSDCTYNCNHSFAFLTGSEEIAWGNNGVVVLANFARNLERERDEAREELDANGLVLQKLQDERDAYIDKFERAEKQLEAMREALKEAHQALKMIHDVVNEQVADAVVIVPLGYAAAALAKLQPFLKP